jgi:CheY-like chemotaxis protein
VQLQGSSEAGSNAGARIAGQGRRVLVTDDNRDQAESMAMLIQLMGHDVRTAFDGPQALETALVFVPDIALIDIGMPGMDGNEIARRFKAQPTLRDTILVAVTGWAQEKDRQRTREAGFAHHLVKPADPAEIQAIVESLAA